jgi:hypothetical protein
VEAQRWVVVSDDPTDLNILCVGPYLWDGVTAWEPPEQGRLMLEQDADAAGYIYPNR